MNEITNNNIKCTIALAALQNVVDPEIGLNVVDLGLIYQVDFNEDVHAISLSMTLTTQLCPMGESMVQGVTKALQQTFPDDKVHVCLTFVPPWSNTMISTEGKEYLNI